ncbi:MAG: hypothetical protein ACRDNT_04025 [Streptosporangiaceae bacterium]
MSLSRRQQRLLTGIDNAVSRSDPRLASMLATFGQLTTAEPMPRRGELRGPATRIRDALLLATAVIAAVITRAAGAACRTLRRAAATCPRPAVRSRARHATSPGTPAAGTRTAGPPDRPGPSRS